MFKLETTDTVKIHTLNCQKKIKQEKGSITLYVLISMMFFLVVIFGIYVNSSNKIQKQEEEINKVQKEYEKENVNDIYEKTYNNYVNTETPTIQVYDGKNLKSEVMGEKVSSRKEIYLSKKKITFKFLSNNTSDKYAYSTTPNGEKTIVEGNTLDIEITTTGKTIYVYIVDNKGNYSEHYTALTMILVTLQDKTIYVEEGKEIQIGEIQGENVGNITFGQVEDSSIIKLNGDTVTGLKAGTTTLVATEGNAEATATIIIKVVKIELAESSGTMLMGNSKTVKITGTNIGTLSVKTSNEEVAKVSLNNNEIIITTKKAGSATITVTESNANAEASYEVKVVSVESEPNGGTYTMPTEGNATLRTTVTAEGADKIETAWSDNAGEWGVIENNKLVEKTNLTSGTYYLYVRINGEAIYKSKEFIVGENTLETSKITITSNETEWTNGNITATVTYGSTLTTSKKAGYGTTLTNAQTAASTSTTTSLTATANGYFYAEATDAAGNKITASLPVTKIDKTKPIVTGATATTNSIAITATDELSGIVGYAVTTANTAPTEFTSCTSTTSLSTTVSGKTQGTTYYVWVKDAAGNVSASKSTSTGSVTISKGNITSSVSWSGTTATVKFTTSTGYYIQTSTNGTSWTSNPSTTGTATVSVTTGTTVYARLTDSSGQYNSGDTAAITPILSYTISFNGNGATSGSMANLTSRAYGTSYTLTSNAYSIPGYNFKEWNTKADGSGTSYADGASVKNLTTTNGATVTLYAQWELAEVWASDISFTSSDSNWNVTDVQEALDDLLK